MRRCVSALLGVSALVLCISGLPLTVDSAKSLGRFNEKLEKLTELRDAEMSETVDFLMNNVDKAVDSDAELDPVERNYPSPTGGSPYGASPYGASPYGSSPYGASPYGSNPYGSSPHGGSPYGGSPYGGSPGGSSYGGSPYGGSSHGGSPYGGSSHGGSPYGGSSYGASPYGGSQYGNGPPSGNPYGGKSPSNNYGNSYGSPVTSPSFHSLKPTTAAQNMYSQGNGQSYGTVSGDSYDSYNQYGRRRRSAELEVRTDAMLEKLKNFVENKAESEEVDTTLEENAEPVERLGQYDGYGAPYGNTYGAPSGSYGAPYGSPSGSYGAPYSAPYGNSYNAPSGSYGAPYSAPYGNSYGAPSGSYNAPSSAPYGNSNSYGGSNSYNPSSSNAANSVHQPAAPDSAKINQAAASTKSIYMTGGTSSTRPQDSTPYQYQQYQPAY